MDYIRDESKMVQCLNEIVLINVNKMSANNRSNDADIAEKYQYWKPIIFWQLKQYEPQIIIFGDTFQFFQEDLGIEEKEKQHKGYVDYIIKGKRMYLHAYHPAQTQITREEYVQDIINVVKANITLIDKIDVSLPDRETAMKLSKMAWNHEEIASALKLSKEKVELILEISK
jgi:hypothetical protein